MTHVRVVQVPSLPRNMGLEQLTRIIEELFLKHASAINAVADSAEGTTIVGTVSLATAPATTTDIADASITAATYVGLEPTNLMAAAEIGAGNLYVTNPAPGVARINHTASAQSRTFKYLLVGLVLFFFGMSASAQQIQSDGTPVEVRPALNFTGDIDCSNDADSTNCGVAGSGDVMLASEWATVYGAPYVDLAVWAESSGGIDSDGNFAQEMYFFAGNGYFDSDEDGNFEISLFPAAVSLLFDPDSDGLVDLQVGPPGAGMGSARTQFRDAAGIGVGQYSTNSYAIGASACLGREQTPDKLFEDKDCDYNAGTGIEAPASTNSEAFITDMQRLLSADVATDGAGGADDTVGIQATGLKLDLDWVGAYWIEYQILSQSSAAGTGLAYGVEYTGTETSLFCTRTFTSTGTGGATGVIDDVAATLGGQFYEGYTANAASTTAPNLGPNQGVQTPNSTAMEHIRCNLLTTTVGDLTFHFASEVNGNAVTVKANSMVRATPFP